MIELCTWRARIGLFRCSSKSRSNSKVDCASEDSKFDTVGLSDLLLAVVCCLFYVSVLRSLVVNLEAVFVFLQNGKYVSPIENRHFEGTVIHSDIPDPFLNDGMHQLFKLQIAVSVCVAAHAWLALKRLLVSGDVEPNPGPDDRKQNEEDSHVSLSDKMNQILSAIEMQNKKMEEQKKIMEEQNKKTEEQAKKVSEDLSDIKEALQTVDRRCEEISHRCDSLEKENQQLTTTVAGLVDGLNAVSVDVTATKRESDQLSKTIEHMQEQINNMTDDIDRLESFSRRDNLRFYGIPESDHEDYTKCVNAVIETLNKADGDRTWTNDDIIRAHRVGEARHGRPKPMIAKFRTWTDKMFVIRDRQFRDRLESIGVRVANDLTRQQAAMVARARQDGQAAYFVRGRMVVGPRRPDPHTYAEVTAGPAMAAASSTAEMAASRPVHSSPMTAATSTTPDTAMTANSDEVFPDEQIGSRRADDGGESPSGHVTQQANRRPTQAGRASPQCGVSSVGHRGGGGYGQTARGTGKARGVTGSGRNQGSIHTFLRESGSDNTSRNSYKNLRSSQNKR